jgi:hypothetical protein
VAEHFGIIIPTLATLAKYALTEDDWKAHLEDQMRYWDSDVGVCGECGKVPGPRRLYIDHAHVRGWKVMKPVERKQHVRGLICYMGNKFRLARGSNIENLQGAADYLGRFENRRVNASIKAAMEKLS